MISRALGRGEEYVLIPLDDGPLDETATLDAARKGFWYCGVMGVINGVAAARCNPDLECQRVMMAAAFGFALKYAEHIRQKPCGDAVAWLEQLMRLEDARGN